MRRRLLMITRYFPPLDSIATSRLYAWAKYLQRMGYEITVLTTSKEGQVLEPINWDCSAFEVRALDYWDPIVALGGPKAAWSSASTGKGIKGRLTKIYRERMNERMPGRTDPWIIQARSQLHHWKKQGRDFDFILSSYGPPSAHIVAFMAKKIFDIPWIADYRDLWLENHISKGCLPFTWMEWGLERWMVACADRLTTVSEGLAKVLRKKFPKIPCLVIENGFDPELMDLAPKDYFQDGGVHLVYTGSIYSDRQDPSPLFEVLRRHRGEFEQRGLSLSFFGNQLGRLEDLVRDFDLGTLVHAAGYVSRELAYSIQKSANGLLFLESPQSKLDGVLTGKLFEYLYAGVPILAVGATPEGAPGQIIRRAQAGWVCGTRQENIYEALRKMMDGAWPIRQMEHILPYSRETQSQRLHEILQGI